MNGQYILTGNDAQIFQEYLNSHPEILNNAITLTEYLHELEISNVSFELNERGELEFYGGDKNIMRLRGLIERQENSKLKSEFLVLARSEYFDKTAPRVKFEYPSMKKCCIANIDARKEYRDMCIKQYGVPYHILFSQPKNQELITSKLVEKYSGEEYILTWDERERERAMSDSYS